MLSSALLALSLAAEPGPLNGGLLRFGTQPIQTVCVQVEVEPLLAEEGVDAQAVREALVAGLRACGLGTTEDTSQPRFRVAITGHRTDNPPGYVGHLETSLNQVARLESYMVVLQLWDDGVVIDGPQGNAPTVVRLVLGESLERFCEEYQRVRPAPKKKPAPRPPVKRPPAEAAPEGGS